MSRLTSNKLIDRRVKRALERSTPSDIARCTTVRGAKATAKRIYTNGCSILGYDEEGDLVYSCRVLPEHFQQPGGKRCFSDRHDLYQQHHGVKGEGGLHNVYWSKPIRFETET